MFGVCVCERNDPGPSVQTACLKGGLEEGIYCLYRMGYQKTGRCDKRAPMDEGREPESLLAQDPSGRTQTVIASGATRGRRTLT